MTLPIRNLLSLSGPQVTVSRLTVTVQHLERELEQHVVPVHLPRSDNLRREVEVVDGVGETLRLQAQRAVLLVHLAALALLVRGPVAGVELHPGLVRPQLKRPGRTPPA